MLSNSTLRDYLGQATREKEEVCVAIFAPGILSASSRMELETPYLENQKQVVA